jgi:hypothetical protein
LPAAEIADSGEPMPANVPQDPAAQRTTEREYEQRPVRDVPAAAMVATPAIRQAVEQIHKINKDLQWVLLELEKAVETLEDAEVQKFADEREIESLKNAMRQLNRTRESLPRPSHGPPPPRHEQRSRHPQRDRRDRRFPGRQPREPRGESPNPSSQSHTAHEAHEPPAQEETNRPDRSQEPDIPV